MESDDHLTYRGHHSPKNEPGSRRNGREKPRIRLSAQMSKIGTQCQHSDFLNNSTISGAIEHMTILSWSLEPALPARLVPTKICSFPTEIFTLQPRHPFYSSLWSLQHFWCITLPSPQTMAILCLRDSLYPSSQALSGTSHPILLHQFHLFSVSTFFFSACHQECSIRKTHICHRWSMRHQDCYMTIYFN